MAQPSSNVQASEPPDLISEWHACISSDYASMRAAQQRIHDMLDRFEYDPESIFAIRLAVEETLINAIKHGNKFDPQKTVRVDVVISPRRFCIDVADQGGGFDRSMVPDPVAEENLGKPSGRGLLLIESFMNEVTYTDGGRHVHMVRANRR